MNDLLKKFDKNGHFELEMKFIYTLLNEKLFMQLQDKINQSMKLVSFYQYGNSLIMIDHQMYRLTGKNKEELFYQACLLCKEYKTQCNIFNLIPYRMIYPIFTIFVDDGKNSEIENVLYPNITLLVQANDPRLVNQIKAQARLKNVPIQLLYKKDFVNQSLVDTLVENMIERIENQKML